MPPLGVVPQRDRRPRLIVDYTFSGVSGDTLRLAPRKAMQAHPRYEPVYLAKIDVADGLYRVRVHIDDVPKLGIVLPTAPGNPILIAFPLVLPMGWVESPPYFTALTETACDRTNALLSQLDSCLQQEHRLESMAATPPANAPNPLSHRSVATLPAVLSGMGRPPVSKVNVYVDNFILMAQTHHQRTQVMRATLSDIEEVMRLLSDSESQHCKEWASV